MDPLQPAASGYVELGGRPIWWEHYRDHSATAPGARETVCLLNGLAMHTGAWASFLPLLLPDHDVLLYDYPGQGKSCCADRAVSIPDLARALALVLDRAGLAQVHLMGISYGGFVGLEFARLFQDRLHTLTISGILLSREELFEMYEELSLVFYRGDDRLFEVYTYYMYEKIFGETFVQKLKDKLPEMRRRFFDRYRDQKHCLVRLTEAQDPFFAALDENMPGYRAIATPTLVLAGAEDRAIPPQVQRKIADILPNVRFELVPDTGHVVYLEQPALFFGMLKKLAAAKSLEF